jgi:phage/plasmid primase-like uncharacterized protein
MLDLDFNDAPLQDEILPIKVGQSQATFNGDTPTIAIGRWPEIFAALGIDVGNGRHMPCPACGGTDRFRFDDQEGRGTWFCNQCSPQAGDGFALVKKVLGFDFAGAVKLVREVVDGHGGAEAAIPNSIPNRQESTEAKAQRQEQVSRECTANLEKAEPASPDHPYLQTKQVGVHGDLRQYKGVLLLPARDASGRIWTHQEIYPEPRRFGHGLKPRDKNFPVGGKKKGCFFEIPGNDLICIAEGYADAATVREAEGATVYITFDAGNMVPVAEAVRRMHPGKRIIIAGDDDAVGRKCATEAALAVGGVAIFPRGHKDFNDLMIAEGIDAVREQLRSSKPVSRGFELISIDKLELKPTQWLIKGLFEADALSMVFGDPGCGKSFLGIDVAGCTASGIDFHGHKVKQKGPVVYIAGEGHNGLGRRFTAWSIRRGIPLENLPIFISKGPAALCDERSVKEVLSAIDNATEQIGQPVLVVIDTVARNFGPGDENSTSDMTMFVNAADQIRQQYGAAVQLVHHTGHANKHRGRGSMALKGALDAEYRLDKDESAVVRMEATKMKDGAIPEPMAFRIRSVELPLKDDEGNNVTSAVLDKTSFEPPAAKGKVGRGKNQTVGMETLRELYKEHRGRLEVKGFDPNTARVTINDWRRRCSLAGMNREGFRSILESLPRAGIVEIANGYVDLLKDLS